MSWKRSFGIASSHTKETYGIVYRVRWKKIGWRSENRLTHWSCVSLLNRVSCRRNALFFHTWSEHHFSETSVTYQRWSSGKTIQTSSTMSCNTWCPVIGIHTVHSGIRKEFCTKRPSRENDKISTGRFDWFPSAPLFLNINSSNWRKSNGSINHVMCRRSRISVSFVVRLDKSRDFIDVRGPLFFHWDELNDRTHVSTSSWSVMQGWSTSSVTTTDIRFSTKYDGLDSDVGQLDHVLELCKRKHLMFQNIDELVSEHVDIMSWRHSDNVKRQWWLGTDVERNAIDMEEIRSYGNEESTRAMLSLYQFRERRWHSRKRQRIYEDWHVFTERSRKDELSRKVVNERRLQDKKVSSFTKTRYSVWYNIVEVRSIVQQNGSWQERSIPFFERRRKENHQATKSSTVHNVDSGRDRWWRVSDEDGYGGQYTYLRSHLRKE